MEKETIPRQRKGASFDVRESQMVVDREEAIKQYLLSKRRLFDISNWGTYAQEDPEAFVLTDPCGNETLRPAIEGDHIKIHLPGPQSTQGDGSDWVVIEKIMEEHNKVLDEVFTAITLRPCVHPKLKQTTAHFYTDQSTNTLMVCRHKIELVASVHGRNELVNTDTNWLDLFRNLLVALPAKAGLSNPHWKKLAKGLIDAS